MYSEFKIKNKYFFVTDRFAKDCSKALILEQPNLIGLNIVTPDIQSQLKLNINTYEYQNRESLFNLLILISNNFGDNKELFNFISELDHQFSIVIFAIIELYQSNNQFKEDSLNRVVELLFYFISNRNQNWIKHPLPSRSNPWLVINGVNSKKFKIIENILSNISLSVVDKIFKLVEYFLNNKLPKEEINFIEEKNKFIINLIENGEIKFDATYIPQIYYINSKSPIDFEIAHRAAPVVINEVKNNNFQSSKNMYSRLYIHDYKDYIKDKEALLKILNRYNLHKKQPANWICLQNTLYTDYLDTSLLNKDEIIFLVGKKLGL